MKKVLSVLLVMIMAITSIIAFVPAMEVEAEEFEQQNILQVNANSSNDYISGSWYSLTNDSNTIRKAGCGIVSLVSAVYNLGGTIDKKNIGSVIDEVFDWAYSKGYWTGADATYWSMFTNSDDEFGNKYGFSVSKQYGSKNSESTSLTALVNHIKNGTGTAVVHVYGHFMVVVDYKVDSGKEMLRVFDPAPGVGSNYNSIKRKGITHAAGDWFELSVLQRDGGTKGTEGSAENIEIDAYWLITPTSVESTQPTITPATITEGTYYFSNDDYKMYMISDTSGKNNIGASNGTVSTKYQFNVVKDGSYYKIVPVDGKNGYVLNSYWASGSTTKNGDEVTLYKNTTDPSQRWIFEKCGDGYLIHPADATHLSITREGNKLYVKTTTKAANQIWTLESPECSHTYDNACDTTCNKCGAMRTTSHSFSTKYTGGTAGHWYQCTECGEKKDISTHEYSHSCDDECNICGYYRPVATLTHTYDNVCDDTCNHCGGKRKVSHVYDSDYSNNENGHWHICTVCGTKGTVENHTPGASATETTPQTCTKCGYVIQGALGHTHNYSSEYEKDANQHWNECACGAKSNTNDHVYDNGCDTSCNICDHARTTNHTYDNGCDTSCNECGYVRTTQHVYEHNCDTDCNECGYVRSTHHDYDHACDTACNVCGETRETEHEYDNEQDAECNVCGYTRLVNEPDPIPDSEPNPNDENKDDEGINTTTIVIIAAAVGAVSILGTVLVMKRKR